ncbi:sterol desaturase family protein [Caulobacter sp. 17J65-9]|uniref:sterol desaturase family protein n=1 Tax=Caulobacter sp. 17J65-9 TaxID=2709382 RepID=UPI0013CA6ACA|nr:sterol desaturase family protein [Caulobacter sp. 17J65-9]NEX92249.1 sterol desaturase family protein [Caulobacter sp. 17J65-9]
MYPNTLDQWWSHLSQAASGVLNAAILVGCLTLLIHHRDLRGALKRAAPKSLRFNLIALAFDTVLVLAPLTYLAAVTQQFLRAQGLVLLDGAPLAQLPPVVVVLVAVFFGDFIAYFRHRLEHSRLLWPSHVMHHSDTDLNWTSVYRFHPINRLTTVIIDYGVLVALGFPPYAIALNGLVRHYYGMFVHMNVPWTFGPLGWLFVSPAMHRWHHVLEGEGVGSNFGSVLAVFDRLFGTHYLPGPCDKPLGVTDVDNDSIVRQLALPFTRAAAFVAERVRPSASGQVRA